MGRRIGLVIVAGIGGLWLSSCRTNSPSTQAQTPPPARLGAQSTVNVDVAVAKLETIDQPRQYTGTTNPNREVTLRARVEGQLLELAVDRGDLVQQGQIIGRQDDGVLKANVLQSAAELAAREAELARIQTLVANAKAQVERARLELQQAQADARRLNQLAKAGAITPQQAEQAETKANTARQTLKATEAQLQSQQAEVATAQKRVEAQRAILQQAEERLAYTVIRSPITGIVTAKTAEAGNLLQGGNEIVKIADFATVKVVVEVSELDRANLSLGQSATVKLDALPNQEFVGQITRISPTADPRSRLIPVEVELNNEQQTIGSGLLARVTFVPQKSKKVVTAPATALRTAGRPNDKESKIFVVKRSGETITVESRPVKIGKEIDGKVVIRSGLAPGEEYVVRSGRPLKDGDKVAVSVLSQRKGEKHDRPGN
ncbi:MAG: efflux RND transporter periplasmic adaptor subunit [Pseudanabaenaceae cyanobacterium SKYGB_i_bin29]|nr:efflux RND transporter periplasmic adaptor subunit [Pseudanabaenaceae cyanobacterium SKYG29]MDW8422052.1 efflux RND transporter periplasmic adaptor subunit [Pseudanabaenaceae cyanobacterium SKYGB_i_bin29]